MNGFPICIFLKKTLVLSFKKFSLNFFFIFLLCFELQLNFNIILVSGVQHSDFKMSSLYLYFETLFVCLPVLKKQHCIIPPHPPI